MSLSVIVITRNEEANIDACLASVAFADEWIVVDSGSSDTTCALAAARGAKVIEALDWRGFGVQKNRALDAANGDWVLSIDADERVSDELAGEIRRVTTPVEAGGAAAGAAPSAAYELSRLSSFCGQWMRHGDWYPDHVLRLVRRGAGRFTDDAVHERLVVAAGAATGRLRGDLLHDTMPSLDHAIDKMNRYSSGRAQDHVRAGRNGGLGAALTHGAWAFLRGYVFRLGFLDGRLGFVLALYVAEGTYYRYLKMALPAARAAVMTPTQGT